MSKYCHCGQLLPCSVHGDIPSKLTEKQERQVEVVRENIAQKLYALMGWRQDWNNLGEHHKDYWRVKAKQILSHPKLRIEDDDQSLQRQDIENPYLGKISVVRTDELANFVKVIKEKQDGIKTTKQR